MDTTVTTVLEDGPQRTVLSVRVTFDLLDNVTDVYLDGLECTVTSVPEDGMATTVTHVL